MTSASPSSLISVNDFSLLSFSQALFERVAPEDLKRYDKKELNALAQMAWEHFHHPRQKGCHSIRLVDPPELEALTLIEVINDDMPFLLDSTLAELSDQGTELRLVAHPVFQAQRDAQGRLISFGFDVGAGESHIPKESVIHIHIARLGSPEQRARLVEGLNKLYDDARLAVTDWPLMRERLARAIHQDALFSPLPREENLEATHFLEWLLADNFMFLGIREYRHTLLSSDSPAAEASSTGFIPIEGSGLGILRDPHLQVLRRGRELVTVTPEIVEFLREPQALIITKASVKSRVHRHTHMDYIGIKQFDERGQCIGELRLLGLFTSTAYTGFAQNIPYLRHKINKVLARANLDPTGHSGKVLAHVLESYPRDELFQIDLPTLISFSSEIVSLYERPRLRVLARVDKFDRFVSVLCYMPRDHYNTTIRNRVGEFLAKIYDGRLSAAYPFHLEGLLVRVHYIVGRYEGTTPQYSQEELEKSVGDIIRTWSDLFREAVLTTYGVEGADLSARWASAFSAGYMEAFTPQEALRDLSLMETLSDAQPYAVVMYHHESDPFTRADLKVFSYGEPMPLSVRVPVLEAMGFHVLSEHTFEVLVPDPRVPNAKSKLWLHDMNLEKKRGGDIDLERLKPFIESALHAVFGKRAESDEFNALVLEQGLPWQDVSLLRAFACYLQQIGVSFSRSYLAQTLAKNSFISAQLIKLFYLQFDPTFEGEDETRQKESENLLSQIESLLLQVESLDEDRILRRFLNLIQASLRTNFFQKKHIGDSDAALSLKFESALVDDLPLPRPLYEIFVYSPRVEGIHLRFGKVARGGIRWSDRPQDFRSEILGLAKAQQVKNAVIVPVGAKGGFVPKCLPSVLTHRDAWLAEGIATYKIFIQALLDLTDNLDQGQLISPPNMVRHDGEDPYLVVAADKGTATFSDIANSIAAEHHFWLDDAFASGGSAGYDHKGMGITARGAWEAVSRHFREMDFDIQTQPFTVAGIGDMSGDVFGNGMLLSPTIRLVAAFDHRDIFVDPEPDPPSSFAERARLFALPRSSWQDYSASLISKGGGVFSRKAKEIKLSPEIQALLHISKDRVTPQDLLQAILKAPVDLLWFGGIGTYVKAQEESQEAAADRANDAIRINASDLNCKVIGEGANLGMTQRGRIEAARRGIRLDTDAIDNSAGVNTSDIEVNIKIALSSLMREGQLERPARDQLLQAMTGEVAELVLRNNYQQPLALSLSERQGVQEVDFLIRFMNSLENQNRLNRQVEFLPSDMMLEQRKHEGAGLTRPELAVLLAYAKLELHDELLYHANLDDPYLSGELFNYFPKLLQERFPTSLETHPLRREIIATCLSNAVMNHLGVALTQQLRDEREAKGPEIAMSYSVARDIFSLPSLYAQIDALDKKISGALQLTLYAALQSLLASSMNWLMRHIDLKQNLKETIARFAPGVETLSSLIFASLGVQMQARLEEESQALQAAQVPQKLANQMVLLPSLAFALDILLISEETKRPLEEVTSLFFSVNEVLDLTNLMLRARDLSVLDYYDRLSRDRSLASLERARFHLTKTLAQDLDHSGTAAVQDWWKSSEAPPKSMVEAWHNVTRGVLTLSRLSVAAALLAEWTGL